jgi:hypothetical protein
MLAHLILPLMGALSVVSTAPAAQPAETAPEAILPRQRDASPQVLREASGGHVVQDGHDGIWVLTGQDTPRPKHEGRFAKGHLPHLPQADPMNPHARAFDAALEFLSTRFEEFDAWSHDDQEAFAQAALSALAALYPEGSSQGPHAPHSLRDRLVGTVWADHDAPETVPRITGFASGVETLCIEYPSGAKPPRIAVRTLASGDQILQADDTPVVWLVRPNAPLRADQVRLVAVDTLAA